MDIESATSGWWDCNTSDTDRQAAVWRSCPLPAGLTWGRVENYTTACPRNSYPFDLVSS